MPNRAIAETPRSISGIAPDVAIAIMSLALAAQASYRTGALPARGPSPGRAASAGLARASRRSARARWGSVLADAPQLKNQLKTQLK